MTQGRWSGRLKGWMDHSTTVSFLVNFLGLTSVIVLAHRAGWPATALFYAVLAVMTGLGLGLLLRRASLRRVARGTIAAAILVSVPVILVTYGFALLGLPIILVYAALVVACTRFAAYLKP